jgi:hypothetical protein
LNIKVLEEFEFNDEGNKGVMNFFGLMMELINFLNFLGLYVCGLGMNVNSF